MTEFMQQPVVQALAWALVHFVWQGAAIGLAAYVAFRVVRTSASARYAIGVGALVAMLAAPAATFVTLVNEPIAPPSGQRRPGRRFLHDDFGRSGHGAGGESERSRAADPRRRGLDGHRGRCLACGRRVLLRSACSAAGSSRAATRVERSSPASDHIQALARQLADRLAVRRVVSILQSHAVAVPVMIGWLKPTIVFPVAALAGLSPDAGRGAARARTRARAASRLSREPAAVGEPRRCSSTIPPCGGCRAACGPNANCAATISRSSVCDRLVYATALTDLAAMASPGCRLGRDRRRSSRSRAPDSRT